MKRQILALMLSLSLEESQNKVVKAYAERKLVLHFFPRPRAPPSTPLPPPAPPAPSPPAPAAAAPPAPAAPAPWFCF